MSGTLLSPLGSGLRAKENYQLQSGDVIAVQVYQEPDLAIESRISADGNIRLPLIGSVDAAGKSLPQLQEEIYQRYDKDYLVNPQISLHILEYSQKRVRIRGKVNRPGFILIPPEEKFTVMDAIAAAGDLSAAGNEKKVELHRTNEKGESSVMIFDLSKAPSSQNLSDTFVRENDIIVVPEKLF